jgi:hypothetical protein
MKISNRNARRYVQDCIPFKGNNLYGEKRGDKFVVFSYGSHHPLFLYKDGVWYENTEKRSVSTSRHRTQAHPHFTTVVCDTATMKNLAL